MVYTHSRQRRTPDRGTSELRTDGELAMACGWPGQKGIVLALSHSVWFDARVAFGLAAGCLPVSHAFGSFCKGTWAGVGTSCLDRAAKHSKTNGRYRPSHPLHQARWYRAKWRTTRQPPLSPISPRQEQDCLGSRPVIQTLVPCVPIPRLLPSALQAYLSPQRLSPRGPPVARRTQTPLEASWVNVLMTPIRHISHSRRAMDERRVSASLSNKPCLPITTSIFLLNRSAGFLGRCGRIDSLAEWYATTAEPTIHCLLF